MKVKHSLYKAISISQRVVIPYDTYIAQWAQLQTITKLFLYLFLAALGLRCCARAFCRCGEWGLLFVVVHGLLIAVSSLVGEHRLQSMQASVDAAHGLSSCSTWAYQLWHAGSRAQAQQLWHTGLVAPWHVGSSRTRARTRVPCIGRQILNHCITREAPN